MQASSGLPNVNTPLLFQPQSATSTTTAGDAPAATRSQNAASTDLSIGSELAIGPPEAQHMGLPAPTLPLNTTPGDAPPRPATARTSSVWSSLTAPLKAAGQQITAARAARAQKDFDERLARAQEDAAKALLPFATATATANTVARDHQLDTAARTHYELSKFAQGPKELEILLGCIRLADRFDPPDEVRASMSPIIWRARDLSQKFAQATRGTPAAETHLAWYRYLNHRCNLDSLHAEAKRGDRDAAANRPIGYSYEDYREEIYWSNVRHAPCDKTVPDVEAARARLLLGQNEEAPVFDIVASFLDGKADSNLTAAAAGGNVQEVTRLLDLGLPINGCDREGFSPLMHASQNGKVDVVRLLLQRGAALECPGARVGWESSLYLAAHNGHVQCARLLIEKGADVNWRNAQGRSPLSAAKENGLKEMIKLLETKGALETPPAQLSKAARLESVRAYTARLQQLLAKAADQEEGRVNDAQLLHNVQQLLLSGADPAQAEFSDSSNCLLKALSANAPQTARLLAKSAPTLINQRGFNGKTAMMSVAASGDLELLIWLQQQGGDANLRDNEGKSVLQYLPATQRAPRRDQPSEAPRR